MYTSYTDRSIKKTFKESVARNQKNLGSTVAQRLKVGPDHHVSFYTSLQKFGKKSLSLYKIAWKATAHSISGDKKNNDLDPPAAKDLVDIQVLYGTEYTITKVKWAHRPAGSVLM